jgi:hypothetical protein
LLTQKKKLLSAFLMPTDPKVAGKLNIARRRFKASRHKAAKLSVNLFSGGSGSALFLEHLINVVFLPTLQILLRAAMSFVFFFGRGLLVCVTFSPAYPSGIIRDTTTCRRMVL